MLNLEITNDGFKFSAIHNGVRLDFNKWNATDDCIYYLPLATLVDNGMAEYNEVGCFVSFDSIYYLDTQERRLLGLPKDYCFEIRLRSNGTFGSSDFTYGVDFLSHVPDGEMFGAKCNGNVVYMPSGESLLLSKEKYDLLKLVEKYNNTAEELKTTEYNLREFCMIKQAAIKAGVQLDSYLENEDVVVPEQINIELGREGDILTVMPSVDIEDSEKFKKIFESQRHVLNVYPVSNDEGKRTRIVLSPTQKENLEPIKKHRCRYEDPDEIKNILEHPTEFFDPERFNLNHFYSERVIDLGFYKPKFYPFVSPYKSQWIVEAQIEHPVDGTTNLKFETFDYLDDFDECLNSAVAANKSIVEFHDTKMDVEDAKLLSEMARMQLENPQMRVKVETDEKNKRRVLIIEDNTEDTGYIIGNQILAKENEYKLYVNQNLDESFPLKAHQEEGVAWLQHLFVKKASGCLMADDMGLGKTLQLLYFIDWHAQTHPMHKPYLIVAPISLLENWENEYNRFFRNKMRIVKPSTQHVPRIFDRKIIDKMQKCDIILTNYETVRNSQLNFCAVDFDIVVLDEAQKVKTPGTLVTNAVKALKSDFRVAMTGTPVENTLLDLWCIMDFCVPGLLGNAKEFAKKYLNPLKDVDADLISLGNEIQDKLGIYFMRRLKKDAAKDLPNKIEKKEAVNMPSIQESAYRRIVENYSKRVQPNILKTIQGIREVSEHPYLHDGSLDAHDPAELIDHAARLQALITFLNTIKAADEKVIIFAERKDIQKMLQRIVRDRYGFTAKIINGDTPTSSQQDTGKQSRQSAIDEFQNKPGFGVIIMSPIAAGMGLNVTAANHVIHYSRHWNPAKENQATDRAYRIGQEKDVYVYYPMATSTHFQSFDVILDELLTRKTKLATSTIFPTDRIEVKPEEFYSILGGNNIG